MIVIEKGTVPLFFFNDTATTEIYTLSLHDALPIFKSIGLSLAIGVLADAFVVRMTLVPAVMALLGRSAWRLPDRKSTRLNSSHANISYAVFCLKKNTTSFCSIALPSALLLSSAPLF